MGLLIASFVSLMTYCWGSYFLRKKSTSQTRWDLVPGSLTAVIGMRTEDSTLTGQAVVDPRASLQWRLGEHDRIDAGWGVLSQLPEAQFVLGRNGNPALHAEVSRHFVVGYERHLGAKSRVCMDFYAKEEANLFRSRDDLFRLTNGQVTPPDPDFRYDNGLRGSSRGVEFLLQRRTANRLAGWLSYAYAHTRRHDLVTGEVYPGEYDQTHTINAYGSYRFSDAAGPGGVSVCLDPVGGPLFDGALSTLGWGGRYVLVGFAAGGVPQNPATRLLVKHRAALGCSLRYFRRFDPPALRRSVAQVFAWYEQRKVAPLISARLPLHQTGQGLRALADRRAAGKIVISSGIRTARKAVDHER